jgi:DNA-binding PadR family transcriptional regulator
MEQPDPPLAPATFLILFALASGDKHGYAIMQEARKLSDHSFQMGPATLYTSIQRLARMEAMVKKSKALRLRLAESSS